MVPFCSVSGGTNTALTGSPGVVHALLAEGR